MMQGGKIVNPVNNMGHQSIYGGKFEDEGVWIRHTHEGLVSMANAGPNTNGSQFFICYVPCPHLDGKHTVFGRVIDGYQICLEVERIPQTSGNRDAPDLPVIIADAGVLKDSEKIVGGDMLQHYFKN